MLSKIKPKFILLSATALVGVYILLYSLKGDIEPSLNNTKNPMLNPEQPNIDASSEQQTGALPQTVRKSPSDTETSIQTTKAIPSIIADSGTSVASGLMHVKKWQSAADAKIGLGLYLNDVESYPMIATVFAAVCYEDSITADDIDYRKTDISRHYFNEALAGYCDDITGVNDPFWVLLKLARQGDRAIQLALPDELLSATERNAIKIYAQPMEYMYIRDEIIGYLESMVAEGIGAAASLLYIEYRGGYGSLLSENLVLSYYYGFIAADLGDRFMTRAGVKTMLERWMTDEEIKKAERMIKSLKY